MGLNGTGWSRMGPDGTGVGPDGAGGDWIRPEGAGGDWMEPYETGWSVCSIESGWSQTGPDGTGRRGYPRPVGRRSALAWPVLAVYTPRLNFTAQNRSHMSDLVTFRPAPTRSAPNAAGAN